jgi:hypothetical protein
MALHLSALSVNQKSDAWFASYKQARRMSANLIY